jgi:hypothetical protein
MYEKPEIVVLGNAAELIEGIKPGPGDGGSGGPVDSDLEE